MPKFRKKPVVIEAIQYDGTENSVVEILQMVLILIVLEDSIEGHNQS